MATYKFIKKTNGVQVQQDGIAIHNWEVMPDDILPNGFGGFTVIIKGGGHDFQVAGNTIMANASGADVDITGSGASGICDTLRDTIFLNNVIGL